jgi:hypothetical protein
MVDRGSEIATLLKDRSSRSRVVRVAIIMAGIAVLFMGVAYLE